MFVKTQDDDFWLGSLTAIEHAAIAGEMNFFEFVLDLYEKNLTNEELKQIIGYGSGEFLHVLTVEICEKIANLIEVLYGQDQYYSFFHTNNEHFLFYNFFSHKNIYCYKLEPFMKLLKKYNASFWLERSEFNFERNDLN